MPVKTMRLRAMSDALKDTSTFGTCMAAIVIEEFGEECFNWEPETLFSEISNTYHVEVPALNKDKLQAFITALTTNQFYLSWEIFSNVCSSLAGEGAMFDEFNLVDPEDLAWGVTEVVLSDPPAAELGNTEFSHEVAGYAGFVLAEHGIYQPPKALSFAEYPNESNPVTSLENVFGDDQEMFEAGMQIQRSNAESIDNFVKENVQELKKQLAALGFSVPQKTPTPQR